MEEHGRKRDLKSWKDLERSWSLGPKTGSAGDASWKHKSNTRTKYDRGDRKITLTRISGR
jgi:hypothetical protein